MMVGGVAAAAAVRTFPFRVYSFASPKPINATFSEYSDYLTISDLLDPAEIDPVIVAAAKELGERAGLTLNKMLLQAWDVN